MELLLEAKQTKADDEISREILQERITKKYSEGDYLYKKFKIMLVEQIKEAEFAGKEAKEATLREQAKKKRNGAECEEDIVDGLNAAGEGMKTKCDGKRNKNVREAKTRKKNFNNRPFCTTRAAKRK